MDFTDEYIFMVMQMKHHYDRVFSKRLKSYGLTLVEVIYMKTIANATGTITMTQIAEKFNVTRARVTNVLKGVCKAGYLVKTPIDGRTVALSLNEAGLEIVRDFEYMCRKDYERMFAGLDEHELVGLYIYLCRVKSNMESIDCGHS